MRNLSTIEQQHRNQLRDESPWVWLYEIEIPSSPVTRLRLTNHDALIEFGTDSNGDAIPYYPFPIIHAGIRATAAGDIPTLDVTVANISREVGRLVEQYDGLSGAKAKVFLLNMADIANTAAHISDDSSEVRTVRVSAESCTFSLSAYSLYRAKFPPDRHVARHCGWQYGGDQCGYALVAGATNTVGGGFDFCRKTLAQCQQRGDDESARSVTVLHPDRFGGFLGVPKNVAL